MFLTTPQRQINDVEFYRILQEIRTGNLSARSKQIIQTKINQETDLCSFYDTTHVVGTQKAAQSLNAIFFNHLPFDETCNDPIVFECIDTLEFEISNDDHSIAQFKNLTNLPHKLYLQEGTHVMFLNNKLFDEKICNGTIGIVTKIYDEENVEVTFPTLASISKVTVQRETSYFEVYGKRASRNPISSSECICSDCS